MLARGPSGVPGGLVSRTGVRGWGPAGSPRAQGCLPANLGALPPPVQALDAVPEKGLVECLSLQRNYLSRSEGLKFQKSRIKDQSRRRGQMEKELLETFSREHKGARLFLQM